MDKHDETLTVQGSLLNAAAAAADKTISLLEVLQNSFFSMGGIEAGKKVDLAQKKHLFAFGVDVLPYKRASNSNPF